MLNKADADEKEISGMQTDAEQKKANTQNDHCRNGNVTSDGDECEVHQPRLCYVNT